jgi:hypothetical protein
MPPNDLNWLGIVLAAVSAFALGWLWYGPLFKRARCREAGGDVRANADVDAKPAHTGLRLVVAFLGSFLAALMFEIFLGPNATAANGFGAGFVVGVFFVTTSFGINYAFSQRSLKLWTIDSGYHITQFCLYGLILGAF